MTCCDQDYGRPSWRPQVSAPATYRLGTPRNQHPAVARWHAHLHGLATAIHETSGLGEPISSSAQCNAEPHHLTSNESWFAESPHLGADARFPHRAPRYGLFRQGLVYLGVELLRPEAHKLDTSRGTGSGAASAALAENPVDLADVEFFKIIDSAKGADIQTSPAPHTGFRVYLGRNCVTENPLFG